MISNGINRALILASIGILLHGHRLGAEFMTTIYQSQSRHLPVEVIREMDDWMWRFRRHLRQAVNNAESVHSSGEGRPQRLELAVQIACNQIASEAAACLATERNDHGVEIKAA